MHVSSGHSVHHPRSRANLRASHIFAGISRKDDYRDNTTPMSPSVTSSITALESRLQSPGQGKEYNLQNRLKYSTIGYGYMEYSTTRAPHGMKQAVVP